MGRPMTDSRRSYAERCDCGEPLHYSNPDSQRIVEELIRLKGSHLKVEVLGLGTWFVPRHYIALHGLRAVDLPRLAKLYKWHREVPSHVG